ncbi:MAG: GNAT family N-acetyltransferase [Alphaproteobacteria bacterium]|nr:GNAT family N-acetyltransferase [Alphaproteobacteria bacterium]
MFVLRSSRGQSIATQLMSAAEQYAIDHGRSLLVLDTEAGSDAEAVYQHLGWSAAGQIPNYAGKPNGELIAAAYYYKEFKSAARRMIQ